MTGLSDSQKQQLAPSGKLQVTLLYNPAPELLLALAESAHTCWRLPFTSLMFTY